MKKVKFWVLEKQSYLQKRFFVTFKNWFFLRHAKKFNIILELWGNNLRWVFQGGWGKQKNGGLRKTKKWCTVQTWLSQTLFLKDKLIISFLRFFCRIGFLFCFVLHERTFVPIFTITRREKKKLICILLASWFSVFCFVTFIGGQEGVEVNKTSTLFQLVKELLHLLFLSNFFFLLPLWKVAKCWVVVLVVFLFVYSLIWIIFFFRVKWTAYQTFSNVYLIIST